MFNEQDIEREPEFHCPGPAQFNCERCKHGENGTGACDIAWHSEEEKELCPTCGKRYISYDEEMECDFCKYIGEEDL